MDDDGDGEASLGGSDDERADKAKMNRRLSRRASLGKRGTVFVPAKAGLSEKHVQELREIFGLFELEDSGQAIPADIRASVAEARLEHESPEIWQMLAGLESEEPVDFEEFVALIVEPLGDPKSRAGASRLLSLFGQGAVAQGSVSLEDMTRLVTELALDVSDSELLEMMETAGVRADGRMDVDSFYAAMQDPE
eukprot:TRINITY_DN11793_c0_g1_i2.p1 TRINITY_DN11793_c0_g1~~TRINITY_DN11793_c0_g1_i2.p1  ORF type:complete len:224 (+),score=48.08 TRINITY_DN11793_c0_g1_i2:91-672(+)